MNVHRILAVAGVVLASPLARAGDQKPDPKVLGTREAIVAYCVKVDPSAASTQRGIVQVLTKGFGEETLAKIRKSDEYRRAHESEDAFLAKVDAQNAPKVCSRRLARSQ